MAKKKVAKKVSKKTARKTTSMSAGQKVGIGVGITAAAVTAAGAYFLYGSKDAKKYRKQVKSWTLKAKAEALEALEKAEEMTKDEYEDLIENIGKTYASLREASKGDIAAFTKEMKHHWNKIEASGKKIATGAPKQAKKVAKKSAKKATKKTVKKVVKKTSKKTAKKVAKKTTKKK